MHSDSGYKAVCTVASAESSLRAFLRLSLSSIEGVIRSHTLWIQPPRSFGSWSTERYKYMSVLTRDVMHATTDKSF
jgi:hypothetical protein